MRLRVIVTSLAVAVAGCASTDALDSGPPVVTSDGSPVTSRYYGHPPAAVYRQEEPVVVYRERYRERYYDDPIIQYRMERRYYRPDSRDHWRYAP
jgi:hypothetical protein